MILAVHRYVSVSLLLALASTSSGQAPFRLLYDYAFPYENGSEVRMKLRPEINDRDQVAFSMESRGILDAYRERVYRSNGPTLQTVFTANRNSPLFGGTTGVQLLQLEINNSGDIAFSSFEITSKARVLNFSNAGSVTSSVLFSFTSPTGVGGTVALNDRDQILFTGPNDSMLLFQGGTVSTLYGPNTTTDFLFLNNNELLAMGKQDPANNPPVYFNPIGDPLNNVSDQTQQVTIVALNQANQVLVRSRPRVVGPNSINPSFYAVDPDGNTTFLFAPPNQFSYVGSFNDRNDLALIGGVDGSLQFLAAGETMPIRLLGPGDPFGGSTIQRLIMSSDAINNRGRIAVNYKLVNNVNGVMVLAVPEVPSGYLIVSALLVAGAWRTARLRRVESAGA